MLPSHLLPWCSSKDSKPRSLLPMAHLDSTCGRGSSFLDGGVDARKMGSRRRCLPKVSAPALNEAGLGGGIPGIRWAILTSSCVPLLQLLDVHVSEDGGFG